MSWARRNAVPLSIGGGVLLAGLVVALAFSAGGDPEPQAAVPAGGTIDDPSVPRGSIAAAAPTPAPESPRVESVETAIGIWRDVMLNRDVGRHRAASRALLARPDEARPALMRVAETDPEDRIRASAVGLLLRFHDPSLAHFFRARLADPAEWVRISATAALADLGLTADVTAVAENDASELVRERARHELARPR